MQNPRLILTLLLCLPPALWSANAPSNVRIALPLTNGNTVEISWDDNSDDEDGFELEWSQDAMSWNPIDTARANQTLYSEFNLFGPGVQLFYRVRAISSSSSGNSSWFNAAATFPSSVPVAIVSQTFHGGQVGTPMTAAPPFTPKASGVTITGFSATDLPPGLSLDPNTGAISGTPLADGLFRPKLTVTGGGGAASTFVTFRIIPADSGPTAVIPLPAPDLSAGTSSTSIDLSGFLQDPDTRQAVRLATNLGNLDIILYETATPASYENFIGYVDRGGYNAVVFHRAATLASSGVAVIQAGNIFPINGSYQRVTLTPNVINEPGISNIRGTLAMAKQGGDPDSGSSQWYFNSVSNAVLDPPSQNGGFAVFGRASTPSLPLMDQIQDLPRGTYNLIVNGGTVAYSDFPTTVAPAGPTPALSELVQIQTASRVAPLLHTVANNPAPHLLSASVTDGTLDLTAATSFGGVSVAPTTIALGLTATDLDGNALGATMNVTLRGETFSLWEASQTFPGSEDALLENPDHDVLVNLLEYAFNGDPALTDSPSRLPAGVHGPGGDLAIRFTHRKFAADLDYQVQQSIDLVDWTTIWRTADSFAHPLVTQQTDQGGTWLLTVDSSTDTTSGPETFLRVVVSKTP